MGEFSEVFKTDSVKRSAGTTDQSGCCVVEKCEPPKPKPIPWPTDVCRIVTNVCQAMHPETGKPWLVQDVRDFDEKCCIWKDAVREGIAQLPSKLVSGDTLPNFNAFKEVYINGETVQLFGGQEIPEGMDGFFLCFDGEICYVGNPPTPIIPDEIQIGGDQPAADSEVEMWVTGDGAKTKNPQGLWTSVPNYKQESV